MSSTKRRETFMTNASGGMDVHDVNDYYDRSREDSVSSANTDDAFLAERSEVEKSILDEDGADVLSTRFKAGKGLSVDASRREIGQYFDDLDDKESSGSESFMQTFIAFWTRCGRFRYYGAHAMREARRRKFNFCLGGCSVFTVVFVASLCYTLLDKAPVVFLAQGEATGGQIDLNIYPSEDASAFLNYTQFSNNAAISDEYSYHSPRMSFTAHAFDLTCNARVQIYNLGTKGLDGLEWRYSGPPGAPCGNASEACISKICDPRKTVNVRLIDSDKEKRMALGRTWKFSKIPAGRVLMGDDVALVRNVSAGDTVFMQVDLGASHTSNLLSWMAFHGMQGEGLHLNSSLAILKAFHTYDEVVVPVTVEAIIGSDEGKFPDEENEFLMMMEYESFLPLLLQNLNPAITTIPLLLENGSPSPKNITQILAKLQLEEFANNIPMNLPPERTSEYLSTNYDLIQARVIGFVSRAMYFTGFPEMEVQLDVLSALRTIRFFTIFLGLILSIVLTILFILSAMLIYSLLMISIETRTFELGVHRMVGMKRLGVIEMLLSQALSYSVPAWALGLVAGQILAVSILNSLESSVEVPIDKKLTETAILVATILGLVIPMVAAIVPIRNALQQNLHDSLDTQHSKTMAVKVTIERAEDNFLSSAWLVVGFGLFVFGFLIYYLLPLSLLSFNLTLFFNIFFGILLGLLFGLILLSLNAEHMMEKFVTAVTLWWEMRPIRLLVIKNLVAHRMRNRKTTMMYALALGFIIFISVAFSMELKTAEFRILKRMGTKMIVNGVIPPAAVSELEVVATANPSVVDYAWATQDLDDEAESIAQTVVSNLGHVIQLDARLVGVSPNFLEVTDSTFLIVGERDLPTGLSLSEQLYTPYGSQRMLVPSGYDESHYIESNTEFLFVGDIQNPVAPSVRAPIFPTKPTAMLDSVPRFLMSRFPSQAAQNVLVSLPAFLRLSNGTIDSMDNLNMHTLFLKTSDSASEEDIDTLKRNLANIVESYPDMKIEDFRDFKDSLDKTNNTMTMLFGIASYIAMTLCLFSLMASMYTNIYEQSKEIGVLRAMGMQKGQIVRVYIYEAFVLVLASSLLGIMIGAIMGWTMTLQRVLFTQLPVTVQFPYQILIFVVAGALFTSVVSACSPARRLLDRNVASVIRTSL